MEPISAIVLSLALGAAAEAGKATVAEVVKDAYKRVKQLLADNFSNVPIDLVIQSPESEPRRALVTTELAALKADQNVELVEAAMTLLEAVKQHEPETLRVVGVTIKDVETANIRLGRVISSGTGVLIERTKATGDIVIDEVQAGVTGISPKNV